MSIHLERKDLMNSQQMEVAVNGPDGATHLILCTGVADLGSVSHEIYTFFVGPQIPRRQFVGAIASGAISTIQTCDREYGENDAKEPLEANLLSINADYDDTCGQVQVRTEVSVGASTIKLGISYSVNILVEITGH